jgi:hypothetical protein
MMIVGGKLLSWRDSRVVEEQGEKGRERQRAGSARPVNA